MSALNPLLVNHAQQVFFDKSCPEIHKLGYRLASGVRSDGKGSLSLLAMILNPLRKGIESETIERIEKIIPKTYNYQRVDIPVLIRYGPNVIKL